MKTTYRALSGWDGGAMARRPGGRTRRRTEGRVIDLDAWRAANLGLFQEGTADGPGRDGGEPEEPGPVPPAPRARRDHRRAMCAAELAATLAVAGAAAALALRVLMF